MASTTPFDIRLAGLEIGYGRQRIAGPLHATWTSGCVLALTGPNGCGKTTLVRTMLGFLPALGGTVEGLSSRSVSYVPQLGRYDDGFPVTVAEVVGTGLARETRRERTAKARDALARVDMEAAFGRPFFDLSGGQKQRVLVARALCADADFVAMDEPTAGVDQQAAGQVFGLLRDVAALGKLVVVVTHDLFRAPDEADRVVMLDGDRLIDLEPASMRPR